MLAKFKHRNKFYKNFLVRWTYCKSRGRAEKIEGRAEKIEGRAEKIETGYTNESKIKDQTKLLLTVLRESSVTGSEN
jgi:hypothetical protein